VKILLHGLTDESGFGFVTRGVRDAFSREHPVLMWDARNACPVNDMSGMWLISCMDHASAFRAVDIARARGCDGCAIYSPIDSDLTPIDVLREVRPDVTIACTEYASRLYAAAGHTVAGVVRHEYMPFPADTSARDWIRKEFGCGDNTVVFLAVSDYTWRKGIGSVIHAYRHLSNTDSLLVVVSRGLSDTHAKQLSGDSRVVVFNSGITREHLRGLYLAADVYVSASAGEGFGLPAWDAAHVGLHMVLPHHTAYAELYRVYPHVEWMDVLPYTPYETPIQYYRVRDERDIVLALESSYYKRRNYPRDIPQRLETVRWWTGYTPSLHRPFGDEIKRAFLRAIEGGRR
jgi:glycosyltransferase involved in cell wall biosynthesis